MASQDRTTARQIDLVVGRLDSISTLPVVGAQILDKTVGSRSSAASLTALVESDPALASAAMSLMAESGCEFSGGRFNLRWALEALDPGALIGRLLAVRVFDGFGLDDELLSAVTERRKALLTHNIAVACCSRDLVATAGFDVSADMAYLAGLLHDLGKIALEEVMPKSLGRIIEQAGQLGVQSFIVEREQLGADHAVLGRALANKWQLPLEISLAIWLHHSDTAAVVEILPEARIAQLVQLADAIVLRTGIAGPAVTCGPAPEQLAQAMDLNPGHLHQVYQRLGRALEDKTDLLGIKLPNGTARYCKAAARAVTELSSKNAELLADDSRRQLGPGGGDMLAEFLTAVKPGSSPIDIAAELAVRWQKTFETAAVCVYLTPERAGEPVETVLVEALGEVRTMLVDPPTDQPPVSRRKSDRGVLSNAQGRVDWLLQQLDVELNPYATRMLTLTAGGRQIGAVVFELHHPDDAELFAADYRMCRQVASAVLQMAISARADRHLAERFVPQLKSSGPSEAPAPAEPVAGVAPRQHDTDEMLDALAELAAGAAHELNNPLAVISGRAQLLIEGETDGERKRMLSQISDNSGEAAAIIEGLMAFAVPPEPRPDPVDVAELIEESIQLASLQADSDQPQITREIAADAGQVFVDSAQVASALANVISNAAQSYEAPGGAVLVQAGLDETAEIVRVSVIDNGKGMDAETARRAVLPFYSLRTAGRKRGMGLAFAQRFLRINGCSLEILSEPGVGTTVNIALPRARTQSR